MKRIKDMKEFEKFSKAFISDRNQDKYQTCDIDVLHSFYLVCHAWWLGDLAIR